MNTSFYDRYELESLGFKQLGQDVLISRNSSIYNTDKISIGNKVRIDDFCILVGGSGISLGNFVHIGAYSALYGGSGIILQDFSGLSARVSVYSESDDYSGQSLTNPTVPMKFKPLYERGAVLLERHVIVGSGSTILPGVSLEEGVAVGAHSLVSKNCKKWSIYFGNPARKIKNRQKNILELECKFLQDTSSGAS